MNGKNVLTAKTCEILVYNPTVRSTNLAEAHAKTLKCYRDFCRRTPYLVQSLQVNHMVHPTQAKINLGHYFRRSSHIRSIPTIDHFVTSMYESLHEASWHYAHQHHLAGLFLPSDHNDNVGFSYLDEVKHEGQSDFLKSFLKGTNKPNQ